MWDTAAPVRKNGEEVPGMLNDVIRNSASAGIVISLLSYGIGMVVKKRLKLAIFNPVLISVILVIAFLGFGRVEYESYNSSARFLSYLLTPATVSLAVPLYLKVDVLKKNAAAIFVSILAGAFTSLACIFLMSLVFRLSHEAYVTLLPKSITTAIGIGISEELGGFPSITAAVIIITGILGNVTAEGLLKLFRISNPVAKGLAIGTASHAIGTAKAMEIGEVEGAMSSLSIVVSGVLTVAGASLFANLIP